MGPNESPTNNVCRVINIGSHVEGCTILRFYPNWVVPTESGHVATLIGIT